MKQFIKFRDLGGIQHIVPLGKIQLITGLSGEKELVQIRIEGIESPLVINASYNDVVEFLTTLEPSVEVEVFDFEAFFV